MLFQTPFSDASKNTQRILANKAIQAFSSICNFLAPGHGSELLKAAIDTVHRKAPQLSSPLSDLISAIETVDTNAERITILSIFCQKYSLEQLLTFSNSINPYLVKHARMQAKLLGPGSMKKASKIVRPKLSLPKVTHFLQWLVDYGYMQFASYGKLTLKFKSGVVKEFGNVILTEIRAQVIRLYLQDCQYLELSTISDSPLNERALYRVLETIKFTEKKALSGLDSVAVDGQTGFENLLNLIAKIHESGSANLEQTENIKVAVQTLLSYIKSKYRLHIRTENSDCSSHCRQFALSDPASNDFSTSCDHDHIQNCETCNLLKKVIVKTESLISCSQNLDNEEKDVLLYEVEKCEGQILAWQSHLIRSVQQNQAKRFIVEHLDNETGYIIFDYAMKFLPMKYREKQSEWYGKTGISWHVCVLIAKIDGILVKQTYCSFIENGTQDAFTSACLYIHNLDEIQHDFPSLKFIYDKSDNASCFRNWIMLAARNYVNNQRKIRVLETHNSEAQAGKDQADREIAVIKNKLKIEVAQGNQVTTALEMKKALDHGTSLNGVKSEVIRVRKKPSNIEFEKKPKTNISDYLSFAYESNGVRLWKHYQIGSGTLIQNSALPDLSQINMEAVEIIEKYSPEVKTYKTLNQSRRKAGSTEMFFCIDPICSLSFKNSSDLENHLFMENHVYDVSRQTTSDSIKLAWISVQETTFQDKALTNQVRLTDFETTAETQDDNYFSTGGWALKKRKKPHRLSEKQMNFLLHEYEERKNVLSDAQIAKEITTQMKNKKIALKRVFNPVEYV